jgi:hypothetical protein
MNEIKKAKMGDQEALDSIKEKYPEFFDDESGNTRDDESLKQIANILEENLARELYQFEEAQKDLKRKRDEEDDNDGDDDDNDDNSNRGGKRRRDDDDDDDDNNSKKGGGTSGSSNEPSAEGPSSTEPPLTESSSCSNLSPIDYVLEKSENELPSFLGEDDFGESIYLFFVLLSNFFI